MRYDLFISQFIIRQLNVYQAEVIRDAIDEVEKEHPDTRVRRVPAISHILQHAPPRTLNPLSRSSTSRGLSSLHNHLHGPNRLKTYYGLTVGTRNPDINVLKPENQNPTNVTPLIASLAKGYVNEELIVVGPPPKKVDEMAIEQQRRKVLGVLWKLIERARSGMLDVDWKKEDRINPRSNYLRRVWVGGEAYKVSTRQLSPGDGTDDPLITSQEILCSCRMGNMGRGIRQNGRRTSDICLRLRLSRVISGVIFTLRSCTSCHDG